MFKTKNNTEIRNLMTAHNIKMWELAEQLDVSENTLYRWFRHELASWRKDFVDDALEALIAARK